MNPPHATPPPRPESARSPAAPARQEPRVPHSRRSYRHPGSPTSDLCSVGWRGWDSSSTPLPRSPAAAPPRSGPPTSPPPPPAAPAPCSRNLPHPTVVSFVMIKFLLFCNLLVLCWPLALLAHILYPIVWLITLPF